MNYCTIQNALEPCAVVICQEYFAHHSISGDVLPNMIYLDHGENYTFHIHVYTKGALFFLAALYSLLRDVISVQRRREGF